MTICVAEIADSFGQLESYYCAVFINSDKREVLTTAIVDLAFQCPDTFGGAQVNGDATCHLAQN
jgi:hypothetical protein